MQYRSDYVEKLVIKSMLQCEELAVDLSMAYDKDYFENPHIGNLFESISNNVKDNGRIPAREMVLEKITNSPREEIINIIQIVEQLDIDVNEHKKEVRDVVNEYLKIRSVKSAIIRSVDDMERGDTVHLVKDRIEEALTKDLNIKLGMNYFDDLNDRLRRIFTTVENRIPSYYPMLDEIISNGFPGYTLSVFTARIHGGKSQLMANMAARQILNGHNVALFSLEMSEDMFAQRFDSIFSGLDLNRIYISSTHKRELVRELKRVKHENEETMGDLWIKEFATGAASVNEFRVLLRELKMRDKKPDIVYVDYINLMSASAKGFGGDNLYGSVKKISEELRALGMEFNCPIVSVSQLNRDGTHSNFGSLDFNHIAESMGIPATADFMAIMGTDEDEMTYKSEILYRIVKNRFGGRVGHVGKLYIDKRSLKIYDESELDLWLHEANKSNDERELIDHEELQRQREERAAARSTRRRRE